MVTKTKKTEKNALSLNDDEVKSLQDLQYSFESIKKEIGRVIIGQEDAIEKIFI